MVLHFLDPLLSCKEVSPSGPPRSELVDEAGASCFLPKPGRAFGSCRAITYGADSFTSDLLPAGAILDF